MSARCLPENPATIAEAAGLLRRGKVVVFLTDTLYGIGADATSETAVARVFAIKGGREDKPLLVLAASPAEAGRHVALSAEGRVLAERFWPGPLTLIAPRLADSPLARGLNPAGDTVGVRVPRRASTLALLRAFGRPLTAPSANRSGAPPACDAAEAVAALGAEVALVLDGGPASGVPSTIIDCTRTPPRLVRAGALAADAIVAAIGRLED
jgi:L-threonylcarbamoyladenylate synthase